ncbi:MAG: tRNA pseudouridine(38-40) synthase TruA [Anaerolineales bacterium]|nr:tRNA pseudouridine(38-40) synthase TruA [Anaerolineae bacterium]PWB52084.1 MAG: tRNA pseudouridine(38-40) synthase TruA [Anaerolineales bacterium]
MERYQVILAYDGSHYKGFQRQAHAQSVQAAVENALRKLNWQGKSILAAGRTDTGVHATGQVIAFDLDWEHGSQELQTALNAHLPADVVAREIRAVRRSFHPRHDASWRRYNYRLYIEPVRQPLLEPYAWRIWPAIEISRLNETAQSLIGTHDYGAFGTPPQAGGSTVRLVYEANWKEEAPYLVFDIAAQAFLYHMVRRIVFMQVSIAQGRLSITDLEHALKSNAHPELGDGQPQKPGQRMVHGLAPAQGLILAEVHYEAECLRVSEDK